MFFLTHSKRKHACTSANTHTHTHTHTQARAHNHTHHRKKEHTEAKKKTSQTRTHERKTRTQTKNESLQVGKHSFASIGWLLEGVRWDDLASFHRRSRTCLHPTPCMFCVLNVQMAKFLKIIVFRSHFGKVRVIIFLFIAAH